MQPQLNISLVGGFDASMPAHPTIPLVLPAAAGTAPLTKAFLPASAAPAVPQA